MPWRSPWLGTLHLTTANTPYQLTTLLQAKDSVQFPSNYAIRCLWLTIQVDPDAGSGTIYIGNSNVSTTEYGWLVVATQTISLPSVESNLVTANDLWFLSDTNNVDIHVSFLTR
jgi:hypothetical protein